MGLPRTTGPQIGLTKYLFQPITPTPYSKHECGTQNQKNQVSSGFTTITTRSLNPIQAWMPSDFSTYIVSNFSISQYLGFIVYLAIQRSRIPRPNKYSTLQALLNILPFTSQGFLGSHQGHTPLGLTIYPIIHWLRNYQAHQGTKNPTLSQSQSSSRIPWPCVISFRDNLTQFRNHPEIHLNKIQDNPSDHGYKEMERQG